MENKGFEKPAANEGASPSAPTKDDDKPPAYPQSPQKFDGYEIGFCNVPQDNSETTGGETKTPTLSDLPVLTESEAKEALDNFVGQNCCYGNLKEITFTDFQSSNTYQYELETFAETRKTEYASQPYMGQVIVSNGMPPAQPWSIPMQPCELFKDEVRQIEIPNTSHVEVCQKCTGLGRKSCFSCSGRGGSNCLSCHGKGFDENSPDRRQCFSCNGAGFKRCTSCDGSGASICQVCKGAGRLRWFIQLKVEFKKHRDDYFKKSEKIPDEKLRKCKSKNVFSEQNQRVSPITNLPDPEINKTSLDLINSHASKLSQSRILAQRQMVNSIPMTLCKYNYSGKEYSYTVYGLDHQVYAPEYPNKCCCTIV